MVQEQTVKYLRAFGSYHLKSPSTKLGRPPSKGNPGFNPDLMVMDLVKLRADSAYKSLIHELKVWPVIDDKYKYFKYVHLLDITVAQEVLHAPGWWVTWPWRDLEPDSSGEARHVSQAELWVEQVRQHWIWSTQCRVPGLSSRRQEESQSWNHNNQGHQQQSKS